jgi:hypothetical protein
MKAKETVQHELAVSETSTLSCLDFCKKMIEVLIGTV